MTLGALLCAAAARLRGAGIENPRLEARLLLAHAAGVTPEAVLRDRHAERAVPGLDALLARRLAREPLALVLGRREFWSLDLAVSPATLVPRPDSEAVVEAALAAAPDPRRVLDLGAGTGCLLLAVLTERPRAWGVGVDLSPEAAALARRNARSLGLDGRAAFACGRWGEALDGRFDLVLSNPPYVRTGELAGLAPELSYEPRRALDGGADGLDAFRAIAAALPGLLAPGGVAVLELGAGQAEAVAALAAGAGLDHIGTGADLAGMPRALVARRPP